MDSDQSGHLMPTRSGGAGYVPPNRELVASDQSALTAARAFDDAGLAKYDFAGTSGPDQVDVSDIGRLFGSQIVGMNQSEAASLISAGRRTVVTGVNRYPPRGCPGR